MFKNTMPQKRHTASTQFFVLSSVLTCHCRTYGSKKTEVDRLLNLTVFWNLYPHFTYGELAMIFKHWHSCSVHGGETPTWTLSKSTLSDQITTYPFLLLLPRFLRSCFPCFLQHRTLSLSFTSPFAIDFLSHHGTTTTVFAFHNVFSLAAPNPLVHVSRMPRAHSIYPARSWTDQWGDHSRACQGPVCRIYGGCNVRSMKILIFLLLMFHSSTLHPSGTASERHWTLRVFASTANGGSVYLGGIHAFPVNSSSSATFRRRRKDNRNSPWRRRTFGDVQVYRLTP